MKKLFQNKTKLVFQLAIIGLILVLLLMGKRGTELEKYCPFGGIMSLGSKLWMGSMSCTMSMQQVSMGIVLLLGVVLFSKLFCGYLCPVGTVIEWLNKLYSRIGKSLVLEGLWDRVLRMGKYVLLFFASYFTITTSELWCKKFDPYYATVSGFDSDVVLWAGILTIMTVVFLSVFIRFFWCKYVCPLGALSNIFQNAVIVVPVILLFVLLRVIGVNINVLWLVLLVCIIGAAIEIFRFRFFTVSPFKIQVDKSTCISCKLCDRACPQGIKVSEYEKVTHPDCNLCMDCVTSCKTDNAISLAGQKLNWLPAVAIVVLIALGFYISQQFTLKTLAERWDGFEQVANIKTFEMEGLNSVKCFGSSKSLATKLRHTKGIHGLDTWADQHKVRIYYDGDKLNEKGIREAMFTPSRYRIRDFGVDKMPEKVTLFEVPVDGIFDTYDNRDLVYLLQGNDAICGMATSFGEPVNITIAYKEGALTPSQICDIIEQKFYIQKSGDQEEKVKVDFECASEGKTLNTITYRQFLDDYFISFDQKFNKYDEKEVIALAIYEISMPNADNSLLRARFPYLASHLSFNDNIVRLRTRYTDKPVLQVYFMKDLVTGDEIYEKLRAEKLSYQTRSGEVRELENPYSFEAPGQVIAPDKD
ncbi:MAG: 4Fe-4S binding protein [Candidatus Marinimicrobia bacterium]|nr:4Fe-4S binding protein [Candidatus Neomarinimicrobiota bacterium]